MNAGDARPVLVSWLDRDQAHEMAVGTSTASSGLSPPSGLAIFRGLRDWQQGRVCADVWVGAEGWGVGQVGAHGIVWGG